jgi:hypothetical protein
MISFVLQDLRTQAMGYMVNNKSNVILYKIQLFMLNI